MAELFAVIELQKANGLLSNIVTSHLTYYDACSKFHTVAASAAISSLEKHSVSLLNEDGFCLKSEHYEHEVTEPEPVSE